MASESSSESSSSMSDISEAASEPPDLRATPVTRDTSTGVPTTLSKSNYLLFFTPKLKRETHEFIAGCTAALVNTTGLYPINKLIFRQMVGGYGAGRAADQLKEEGLRYLYRGILPPLVQKMVSVSIMFGSFGYYERWAKSRFSSAPPVAHLAMAACLTGSTEAVLTPLERVQMLLQDRQFHGSYTNTTDALVKLRVYGLPEYYRGLTCVLVRNGPSNILFFGLRDKIKKLMPTNKSTQPQPSSTATDAKPLPTATGLTMGNTNTFHDFISGAILGMFISTLFYPLSVVRTRMQTRPPGTKFLSIWEAFNQVYSERDRKFSRLFRGCLVNVIRQFFSWGIINCSYEFVLDYLKRF